MKHFILGIYCTILSYFFLSLSAYADLAITIQKIKPSIVGVGTYQATRKQQLALHGTGFAVINGKYIVTNYHVVSRPLNTNNGEGYVIITGHGVKGEVHSAKMIMIDKKHDLALLKFEGQPLPALKINPIKDVREGEQYAFTGFPIGTVLGLYPVTHRGIISAITPLVTPMNHGKQLSAYHIKQLRENDRVFVYQLDAVAYPGNSGSPLYDMESGEVIGVLNSVLVKKTRESVLESPSGISYAIPAKFIQDLIRKSGF
jgi:S1-C subfamily serine protease